MRARNLKPDFFTDEALVECDPLARLLFQGLWCLADAEGRLKDKPKQIKIKVLPCDDCDPDALLEQLSSHDLIIRYEVEGERYIQVKISWFTKNRIPVKNHVISRPALKSPGITRPAVKLHGQPGCSPLP